MSADTVRPGTPSSEVPSPAPLRGRRVLLLVLVLVNSAAVWGQAGWGLEHIVPIGWIFPAALSLALAFAAALELIGVFLATMADEGEARGLPSGGIRLGSYAVGLISGGLNFSHWYASGTATAVAFGFLSAISPFLWGIFSRIRRGQSVAPSRRFWHPLRSFKLIRFMAWEGIVSEQDAIFAMEFRNLAPVSPAGGRSPQELGTEAVRIKSEDPRRSWDSIAQELGVSSRYLYECRKEVQK